MRRKSWKRARLPQVNLQLKWQMWQKRGHFQRTWTAVGVKHIRRDGEAFRTRHTASDNGQQVKVADALRKAAKCERAVEIQADKLRLQMHFPYVRYAFDLSTNRCGKRSIAAKFHRFPPLQYPLPLRHRSSRSAPYKAEASASCGTLKPPRNLAQTATLRINADSRNHFSFIRASGAVRRCGGKYFRNPPRAIRRNTVRQCTASAETTANRSRTARARCPIFQ